MADGKEWTTANLNVNASPSYCYDDAERNCRRYGRLYTWALAQRVCQSLGHDWRLPTDDEWRRMAKQYGGVSNDSADKGKATFTALIPCWLRRIVALNPDLPSCDETATMEAVDRGPSDS